MRRLRLSDAALDDIRSALARSGEAFGLTGRKRYEALIRQALKDILGGDVLVVGRILHDAMEPGRHLAEDAPPG